MNGPRISLRAQAFDSGSITNPIDSESSRHGTAASCVATTKRSHGYWIESTGVNGSL